MPYKDPERRRAARRASYPVNKERLNEYARMYREQNPEKRAEYAESAARWRAENKDHVRAYSRGYRLSKYGLTPEGYDEMVLTQGGKCAICLGECATHGKLSVDHCHTSGAVRGLLCNHCNTAIGKLQDDPEIVDRAARYLRLHGA